MKVFKKGQIWPLARQRNHILQDLTGLEIETSMKTSKTKNRFQTHYVFNNRNPVCKT